MRRPLNPAIGLGLLASALLVGCSDEAKVERQTTISGPGGTSTVTEEKRVESTGENPPIQVDNDNANAPR